MSRVDPLLNFRFIVEIEGVSEAGFAACDGLEVCVDVVETSDGSAAADITRKLPGRVHYRNIVLRRGKTTSALLWQWFKSVTDGHLQRRSGSIIVIDASRQEQLRYNFYDAWPCRWKSLVLDASQSGGLVEELELAVERIERG